jgi:hypothetical protein
MKLSATILISTLFLLNSLGSLGQTLYVDPSAGSDTLGTGSQLEPFETLTAALNSLGSASSSSIVVVNTNSDVEVDLLSQATINSSVTIQSSNSQFRYTISLEQFDQASITLDSAAIRVIGGSLTVTNAAFSPKSTIDNLQSFFKVYNAQFTLQNAVVQDLHGLPELVQTSSTSSTASANIQSVQHTNSSAAFKFIKGTHTVNAVTIVNNVAPQALFTLTESTLTFSSVFITGGQALVISSQQTMVEASNITLTNYNGNFLYAEEPTYISLINSAFTNLAINSSNPFFYITGTAIGSSYIHPIEQLIFDNIVLNRPIILVDQASASLSVDSISMNNILKTQSLSEASCISGQNNVGITITGSSFTNVNTNCVVMNSSGLILMNNEFDNSNLPSTVNNPDGVTWVSFNEGTMAVSPGLFMRVTSNRFLNNTLAPINGGAFKITGTFTGFIRMMNNVYEGNEAQEKGGAIYCENYNQQVTASGETFTENKAEFGAALYFVDNSSGSGKSVAISNSSFTNNVNSGSGSVVAINPARLSSSGNTFVGNI